MRTPRAAAVRIRPPHLPEPVAHGRFGKTVALLALLVALPLSASGQTPAGTPIDNQATATYDMGASTGIMQLSNLHTIIVTTLRSPSAVEFLQHAPGAPGAQNVSVPPSTCSSTGLGTGPFNPVPPPTTQAGAPIAVPGPVPLLPASQYGLGAAAFVRLTDSDQDLNAAAVDTVLVSLTTAGDSELVRLSETGVNTGVFTGHIQTSGAAAAPNDCLLQTAQNQSVLVSYVDAADATDTSNANAQISPLSVTFDSFSGTTVNGVVLTLIDDTTGLPATVFGDDTVSIFPSTIATGGIFSDGVQTYIFAPGTYRFPYVPAGTYRLDITPPSGYFAPSAVSDAVLQTLPGAPYALSVASRGQPFVVATPQAIDVDVPLDSASQQSFLVKTASVAAIGVGEFLSYNLRVRNPGLTAAPLGLDLVDVLPFGFRYQSGSATLNDAPIADPAISPDGRTLTLILAATALPEFQDVSYVLEVTAGTPVGDATNRAVASVIGGTESHEASVTVLVQDELFSASTFLMGQVATGACDAAPDPGGLEGVRVYLEDGTYSVSDENGYFQFEGVRPGVHVVQMDIDSLPPQYEPVPCTQNTRFAGRTFSQFADVQGGTMWRTDFRVALRTPAAGYVNAQLHSELQDDRLLFHMQLRGSEVPVRDVRVVSMLPEGTRYLRGTSSVDGEAIADPEIQGNLLTYRFGDAEGRWTRDLEFEASLGSAEPSGRITAQSFAMFETPSARAVRTPVARTILFGKSKSASGVKLVETVGLRPGDTWERNATPIEDATPAPPEPEAPSYDADWLAGQTGEVEFLTPEPGFAPAIPSVTVHIKHAPSHKLELRLNGAQVSHRNASGWLQNEGRTAALSVWSGVDLVEGTNRFDLIARDASGAVVAEIAREIHYAGPPVHLELVPELSQPIADGKTAVVVALRLRDRFGMPARQGVVGDFEVDPPYAPLEDLSGPEERRLLGIDPTKPTFEIGENGIARIELEPTTETGKVRVRLNLMGNRDHEVEMWLEPEKRDWVLVGLAEGTFSQNHLSGSDATLDVLDLDENGTVDERMSLFAKGMVKGEWLLTMAYDSRKKEEPHGESLKQLIDPDRYYALYGSRAKQDYDAPSSSPLYVKVERSRFYALFGDYDTALEGTDLSRYNRGFTGFKTEYDGDRFGFQAFGTETDYGFIRDEIRGDGTTGLYRLSRQNLVLNSEKIALETRDRFKTEVVLSSQPLTRHLDYNVDYADGSLYFKTPIPSKDSSLNPMFIVAEYEAEDDKDDSIIAGGRGSVHFMDDRLELGASVIHEGNTGLDGELLGGDLRYDLADHTQFRAEFASTDTDEKNAPLRGSAYLAEIATHTQKLDTRAYLREQDAEFGLGQQSQTEQGTRKLGFEAAYQLSRDLTLNGEAYRQTNLQTSGDRDILEMRGDYQLPGYTLFSGYRYARDGDTAADGQAHQLLAGGSMSTLDDRMKLRLSTELSLFGDNENPDFPTRAILGADYALTKNVTLFAEQEFAWGDNQDSRGTRMGFKATPWTGATASTSIEERMTESGPRTFTNLGLQQTWAISDRWSVDGSLDHAHTLRDPGNVLFNPNVPPSSGTLVDDFTAVSLGSNYRLDDWAWTGRVETRLGDLEDKWGFLTGFAQELNAGVGYSVALEYFDTDADAGASRRNADARLSLAYRPVHSRWIVLNRIDLVTEEESGGSFDFDNRKLVNNLNINYQWTPGLQISLQYGSKYLLDTIDDERYDGYIDLWGLELRRDLGARWDIGLTGRLKNSHKTDVLESAYGIELGYQLKTNLWVSLGYNFTGFRDDDFSEANYSREGPYLKFRYKFDQKTILDLLDFESNSRPSRVTSTE